MLKAFAFECACAWIACGLFVMSIAAKFFTIEKNVRTVSASTPTAVALVVLVRHVNKHDGLRQHIG